MSQGGVVPVRVVDDDGDTLGIAGEPLRIDPTGTTVQPVSVSALPLPAGAATEATLATRAADRTTAAAPASARLSDGAAFYKATTPADTQPTSNAAATQVDGHSASIGATADADTANTLIGRVKKLVSLIAGGLPAALVGGRLDTHLGSWLGSTAPTVGQKANAASLPVSLATEQIGVPGSTAPAQAYPLAAKQNGVTTLRALAVKYDSTDAEYRLMVDGKMQLAPPDPPPSTTPVSILGYSVVSGNGTETTSYIIPNGTTLTIQQVTIGAEGDPNERGSRIDLVYNNGTNHDIEVYFASSFSSEFFPSTNKAQDGTALVGNGVHTLEIRRVRLGGGSAGIRCVVRGYYA